MAGFHSVGWPDIDRANPTEFDVLVVNCEGLVKHIDLAEPQDDFVEKLRSELKHLGDRMAKLIATGGTAVIIYPQKRNPYRLPGFDCLNWLPIIFGLKSETGKTLRITNQKWERYFSKFKKWNVVLEIDPSATNNRLPTSGSWYEWKRLLPTW